jgi:hypothetical protein
MRRKTVSPERAVSLSFSADDIARAGGAIRVGYADGRPFTPRFDDTVPSPYLLRLQDRFAASLMEEECADLRALGMYENAELVERAGGPRPTLRWLANKLREKTAARQQMRRSVKPEQVKQHRDQWRATHPFAIKEQKKKEREAHYFRPFVAIDAEGRNYPGEDDIYIKEPSGLVLYEKHDTYIWGAAADDGREPEWLTAQGYAPEEKRPVTVYEILDYLLALPDIYGDAVFVSFSFGYDATQIGKSLPFAKVWEICKREKYAPKKADRRPIGKGSVYWGEYAFEYLKGKWLKIYHIRDRETNISTIDENGKRLPKYDKSITIYDTFGFFQSGFSKVVQGMVKAGRATPQEAEYLDSMKKLRDDPDKWAAQPIGAIRRYTTIELRLLAREMGVMRQAFVDMDNMRLKSWHGPGAAASAFLTGREIKKRSYPEDIKSQDLPPWQTAAHHAYHAGHIEMMKHGMARKRILVCLRYSISLSSLHRRTTFDERRNMDGRRIYRNSIAQNFTSRDRAGVNAFHVQSQVQFPQI